MLLISALLIPINVFSPTLLVPPMLTPGAIWQCSPIILSWSILESVFMMVLFPMIALAPITAPGQITTPFPMLALWAINE